MRFSARDYRMPRYKEIPNVGLYLEQTVKYINECLAPIEISITPSMLSNYVKKGYIDRPIKKQYYADQIAYAIYIVIIKQVLSMDNIASLCFTKSNFILYWLLGDLTVQSGKRHS